GSDGLQRQGPDQPPWFGSFRGGLHRRTRRERPPAGTARTKVGSAARTCLERNSSYRQPRLGVASGRLGRTPAATGRSRNLDRGRRGLYVGDCTGGQSRRTEGRISYAVE